MKLTHGPFPSPPKSPQTRSVVLPASEGGAEEGRLLARGQRLVLLQTEAEVAVAEKKREEGTSVFFFVGMLWWVDWSFFGRSCAVL